MHIKLLRIFHPYLLSASLGSYSTFLRHPMLLLLENTCLSSPKDKLDKRGCESYNPEVFTVQNENGLYFVTIDGLS